MGDAQVGTVYTVNAIQEEYCAKRGLRKGSLIPLLLYLYRTYTYYTCYHIHLSLADPRMRPPPNTPNRQLVSRFWVNGI